MFVQLVKGVKVNLVARHPGCISSPTPSTDITARVTPKAEIVGESSAAAYLAVSIALLAGAAPFRGLEGAGQDVRSVSFSARASVAAFFFLLLAARRIT